MKEITAAVDSIKRDLHLYEFLHDKVISYITRDPGLIKLVHSHKSRFKDLSHLTEKIERKNKEDSQRPVEKQKGLITEGNIKTRVTDICGIRILHLHVHQLEDIHKILMRYVEQGELALYEPPKAYTWDPEYASYFTDMGVKAQLKESFYTSVHYVFKAREDSEITCEVQVRTLFEEVWGEVDHEFNYPHSSESRITQEQLKVLARVVGAGSRLVDSIFELSDLN